MCRNTRRSWLGLLLFAISALFVAEVGLTAQTPGGNAPSPSSAWVEPHDSADLYNSLRDVINYGAELFNKQADHAGCYRIYQGALISVRPYMAPVMRKKIDESIARAETLPVYSDRAFELRKVLDEIRLKAAPTVRTPIASSTGNPPPKVDAPPKVGVPTVNAKEIKPRVDLPKIVDTKIDDKKGDPPFVIPSSVDPLKPGAGTKPPMIEGKKGDPLPPLPGVGTVPDLGTKPPVIEEKKVSPPKVDPPKVDSPKSDLPKIDPPGINLPGISLPKKETPKDAPKNDLPKVDLPGVELPKVDLPKIDAPKKETPKNDDPLRIEPPTIDKPKKEAPKVEPPPLLNVPSLDPKEKKAAKTADVGGAVTVDGKGLPAGFFVTLVSAEGKRFTTIVQKEGVYRFGTAIPVGPYRVAVEPALGTDAKVIPARYQDAATSGLVIQVGTDKANTDLRLTK